MDKHQACIMLDISTSSSDDEIMEALEMRVFEFRQKILAKPWHVLQDSKHEEAQRLADLSRFMEGLPPTSSESTAQDVTETPSNLLELFNDYSKTTNHHKQTMMGITADFLPATMESMRSTLLDYYRGLLKFHYTPVDVKISETIDPMYLFDVFKKLEEVGEEGLSSEERLLRDQEISRAQKWLERLQIPVD